MELFDEVKNRYFHIVLRVLNECASGMDKEDIIRKIDEEEFQEKVIGKDCETFSGLMFNEYGEKSYNLLREKNSKYFPAIGTVPVRFTNHEKSWIMSLLEEPNLKLLMKDSTIEKLREALKGFDAPVSRELIELTNISSLPEVQGEFEKNFKVLLSAIMDEKPIRYSNTDRNGNRYENVLSLPLRLEYSVKDGRFRVSMYSLDEQRHIMANIHSIEKIEIVDEKIDITRDKALKMLREKRYSEEPVVFKVTDKKAAMERCFMSFSGMERTSRCIEKDKYEIKLNYYTFEEEEVIRKLLALGPYVKVLSPKRIVDEVVLRIKKAIELSEEGNRGDINAFNNNI